MINRASVPMWGIAAKSAGPPKSAAKTLKSTLLDEDHPFVCPSFLFFHVRETRMQCRVRDWSTARRSLYCPPSRRLWAKSGRRPRSEAGSVAPRAKKNKKRTARVGESFSRDRALLRSTGASQAHYVSRLRFATLRNYQLLACQDLGIEVYFMLFRNQTLRNC